MWETGVSWEGRFAVDVVTSAGGTDVISTGAGIGVVECVGPTTAGSSVFGNCGSSDFA